MKFGTFVAGVVAAVSVGAEVAITGAGASFPAPVYQAWTYSYSQANTDVSVSYQSVGSGAGINQLKGGTIDFAGSDNPLSSEELTEAGIEQFPMLKGAVVVIVNLPGITDGQLVLKRAVLGDIFLGKIKRWNDPRIAADNPGLKLPKTKISVVRRADSSGTSFIFTSHLSSISPEWKEQVGAGPSVKWPTGIGGQKNAGVCNTVSKVCGAIGYTEHAYAVEAKLSTAKLDDEILGTTYILVRKDSPVEKRALMQKYFDWCFQSGKATAVKLGYVPLEQPATESATGSATASTADAVTKPGAVPQSAMGESQKVAPVEQ